MSKFVLGFCLLAAVCAAQSNGSGDFGEVVDASRRGAAWSPRGERSWPTDGFGKDLWPNESSEPVSQGIPMLPQPPAHGGFVSVHQLSIPAKALDAFTDALRLSEKGNAEKAIAKLKRAIQIYPDYYEAYTNLGVQYCRIGRSKEGLEQFEKAVAMGPMDALVQTNVAAALVDLHEYADAEKAARRALELEPHYAKAHFALGYLLARTGRAKEALPHLQEAAETLPAALEILEIVTRQAGTSELK